MLPLRVPKKTRLRRSGEGRARLADGGADDAVVPAFCYKIKAVLGMRFCDPDQLIATKQRNKLAAANKALCYLTRGSFKEDQHTQASLTYMRRCLSLRLFVRNVWLEIALKKQQRESEGEDAERRLLSMRRIDRPPRRRRKFGRERRISRAMADLAGVRGSR